MPQKTNLNTNPYNDDFDAKKNFYKVLFKPGYPIQARELTSLQSIFQNQIESFGSSIFKEGSMVIPGNINYDSNYTAVKINLDHLGIEVSLYIDKLIGKKVVGEESGVSAVVVNYLLPPQKSVTTPTLYVKYLKSGTDLVSSVFNDGENLLIQENIVYGNTTINAGDTIANLLEENATAIGCAVGISSGVYFLRGAFVDVSSDTLILDPYTNAPSYRVGLNITEEIITSGIDNSLYDNARGFSNYAAPGADRLKISTKLAQKSLTDFDDKNFVELIKLDDGEIKKLQNKSQYSLIRDYFAKRTFEESGDYAVDQFGVETVECLNDGLSNGGAFNSNQITDQGNKPSEDLLCVKITPGRAYVRGFDIDTTGVTILDLDKPRDTQTISSASVPFEMGNLIQINNIQGTPLIGINTGNNIINLHNRRKAASITTGVGTGTTIGQARVYAYTLNNISPGISTNLLPSSSSNLYLYDIQTYSVLELNTNATFIPNTSLIRGLSSGASGYVVSVASSAVTINQTSGNFIVNEQISINESTNNSRIIKSIIAYNADDIKSISQRTSQFTGFSTDFTADTVLTKINPSGFQLTDRLFFTSSGSIAIATCPGRNFLGIRSDSILIYQRPGISSETYARVVSVSSDGLSASLESVANVVGVCNGVVGFETSGVTFNLGIPKLFNQDSPSLYTQLNQKNISSVDFSRSSLTTLVQLKQQSTDASGKLTASTASVQAQTGITSSLFTAYSSNRYSVVYSTGIVAAVNPDQVSISNDGNQITFNGLLSSQSSNVTLNATVIKNTIKSKEKRLVRSQKLVVDKTVSGLSTSFSGLSSSPYYGLRIEDDQISLNVPDVNRVIGVFESLDSSEPIIDKLTFSTGLNLNSSAINGEKISGSLSGAIAQLVNIISSTEIEIVYLTSSKFVDKETVTFAESNIIGTIQVITPGQYLNITDRYALDKGQREQYYDYSRIVRNSNSSAPARKLSIYYDAYEVPTSDTGDLYTVNSYREERFKTDIPVVGSNLRLTDTLDFRPRVSRFTSTSTSPFAFESRNFGASGINPLLIPSPNETSIMGYSYYLPRKDKVYLDKQGKLSVIKGVSSLSPTSPLNVDEAMEIASLDLPAYLYNTNDVKITLVDNRRYTMRDIGKLEDRIETLEKVTSLTLLEVDTKTLKITDSAGFDRFKSGFFADDFKNSDLISNSSEVKCQVSNSIMAPLSDIWSLKTPLAIGSGLNEDTLDFSSNFNLRDPNVKKTGDLVTLNYTEVPWINQPLASRVENVNPFNMIEYTGAIRLTPSSDNWVRNVYVPGNRRTINGATAGITTTNVLINTESDSFMRSRNVLFVGVALKASTRHYLYIDGSPDLDYIPKLLEIRMNSGVFHPGEKVDAYSGDIKTGTFRVANSNHKTGPYDNPDLIFTENPYNSSVQIPNTYSASSTTLNIDLVSLVEEAQGEYTGFVELNSRLIGKTSGAVASLTDLKIISDQFGATFGSFFIRDPNTNPGPRLKITVGDRQFKVTSSVTNQTPLPGSQLISSAETLYRGSGIVNTYRQDVTISEVPPPRRGGKDPLAQSFTVDETGAFLSGVDLYFANKDTSENVYVEVRTVELGTPTNQLIQDYASAVLTPSQVAISSVAATPTKVTFPSPVYLQSGKEYSIVVLAPTTNNYELWTARMGDTTIETKNLPDVQNVRVSKQYIGGSLFKSQNGTIWTASQFEDIKFKLYKCKFSATDGTVYFYNPKLDSGSSNFPKLQENAIRTLPRKLKVGVTTISNSNLISALSIGTKVASAVTATGTYGYIENVGGPLVIGGITTTNVGYGYSSATATINNVPFFTYTGDGSGATGNITISSGTVTNVAIASTGNGYAIGDVLGITTSFVGNGSNARLTVSSIDKIDTLYLSNVKGESFNDGDMLIYFTSPTTSVGLANTTVRGTSSVRNNLYSGNVLEIKQFNHGMHSDNNRIIVSDVKSDRPPVRLTADMSDTDAIISVASTSNFATFEGITTSSGYLKIENEIVYYTSINSNNTIGITTRGVDGTIKTFHPTNALVYPYELNGVSLRRINTTFDLPNDTQIKSQRDIDTYHVQFDRSDRSSGTNQLSFNDQKSVGEKDIKVTQNFQYDSITPQYNIITPGQGTKVSAQIRTVSGTSSSGSEVSFNDQGYEKIDLNQINILNSTRLVCSRINETTRLTTLPDNRSFTLAIRFESNDSNLSPCLDLQTAYCKFSRNRLNKPVSNYAISSLANQAFGDKHAGVYISNTINLEQPARSLKVILSAYRHSSADFRVLYKLIKTDSGETEQSYNLFPGYDNLKDLNNDGYGDTVIDYSNNSGLPDAPVLPSKDGEFKEYQYTLESPEPFNGFAIKIVMSGSNEAYPPKFGDIRAIALA